MHRPSWLQQSERSNRFALRLIRWFALHTGRPFARLLLWPIVVYFFLTAPVARRASRDYLGRVHGRPAPPLAPLRHFYWFAATLIDRLYFLRGEVDRFRVEIDGGELLHAGNSRGLILVGAHVGSFDALRALGLRRPELRLKILMFRDHNPMMTQLLESLDARLGEMVIDLNDPCVLQRVESALADGEIVCMLGDRAAPAVRQARCRFLGEPAWFPTGPARLARLFSVPLIAFSCVYLGRNRYQIVFHRIEGDNDRERTCAFASWVEERIREAPLNWFNFYDFWGPPGEPESGPGDKEP